LSVKFMHFNALQPYDTTNSTRSSSPIALGPLLLGICRVPGGTCRKILPYGSPVPSREATWSSSNEVVGELPPTLHMFLRKSGSTSSLLAQSLGRSPMVLSFCTVQYVLYLRTGPWHGGCQQDFFRTTKVPPTAQQAWPKPDHLARTLDYGAEMGMRQQILVVLDPNSLHIAENPSLSEAPQAKCSDFS
jgi:hypothetical protein